MSKYPEDPKNYPKTKKEMGEMVEEVNKCFISDDKYHSRGYRQYSPTYAKEWERIFGKGRKKPQKKLTEEKTSKN